HQGHGRHVPRPPGAAAPRQRRRARQHPRRPVQDHHPAMSDGQADNTNGGDSAKPEAAASRTPMRLPPPPPAGRSARAGAERLPMLDVVLERLGKTLQASLRRLAGDGISVVVEPPANMRMGEYLLQLPSPALLCITRFDGSNAPGLVVAGPDLVFA